VNLSNGWKVYLTYFLFSLLNLVEYQKDVFKAWYILMSGEQQQGLLAVLEQREQVVQE
jgi:hypothetical protein